MARQDTAVNCVKGSHPREADSKYREMSLQSRVNGKATSSRVHTGNILNIVDFLKDHLLSIIPMFVVKMLSDQCVRLNCAIQINLYEDGVHEAFFKVMYCNLHGRIKILPANIVQLCR